MSGVLTDVLTFFEQWKPTLGNMLASTDKRFTDQPIYENAGVSQTNGVFEMQSSKILSWRDYFDAAKVFG